MEIILKLSFINPISSRIGVCQLVIRSSIVHRTVDNVHWIRPLVLLVFCKRWIGIFNFSKQHGNCTGDDNDSKVGKEKGSIVSNFFYKKVARNSHEDAYWKSNATQPDHKNIKLIHFLESHFCPLEVCFRGLSRILVALMGKKPPIPKQSQHHMGQEAHKQTATRTKGTKAHERRNVNASIAIKLHLDLRNLFQRSFGRCIGCISHLFHPFMTHFITKYLKQMEIIQPLIKQFTICVALLTTSKEQCP